MPSVNENTPHPTATRRRELRYQFTPKHHGADPAAACWLTELTFNEEFAIFDGADADDVGDDDGNLYGVERLSDGTLRIIGTWTQQVAEFPIARDGEAWHGYPVYPVSEEGPANRQGFKCRPAKEVFRKMVAVGWITDRQRKRLAKGDEV